MERDWVYPAALFVAFQQVVIIGVGWHIGMNADAPYLEYGLAALSAIVIVAAAMLTLDAWRMVQTKPASAMNFIRSSIVRQRQTYLTFVTGFALAWLQLVSLTWTKSLIPHFTGMWADQPLAAIEIAMFGNDAWRIIHPVLLPYERAIDTLYSLWALILKLTLAAALFAKPSRQIGSITSLFSHGWAHRCCRPVSAAIRRADLLGTARARSTLR